MTDFETHPIGYVAHLKDRIFELEQGACRFNCRTEKKAFLDGFRFGVVRMCKEVLGTDYPESGWCEEDERLAELAYQEYKNEQT